MSSAFDVAARALRHRDRSTSDIEALLVDRGFDVDEMRVALDTLVRTGVLDDARYAENRARSLGDRGAGDAYIRHDLSRARVSEAEIEGALASLEPETERAGRIVARRGASQRTARYLAGKGFSEEVVRGAVAHGAGEELG